MKTTTLIAIAAIPALVFCGWGTVRIVKCFKFEQECGEYLKRAANANTVDLAKSEMTRAIAYLDQHGMTTGYTSVLWKTPSEDVGFWHANLKASLDELESIAPAASPLERSNVLMKLRETLMENGNEGDILTAPVGISVYPSNTAFFWWGWLSFSAAGLLIVGAGTREVFN